MNDITALLGMARRPPEPTPAALLISHGDAPDTSQDFNKIYKSRIFSQRDAGT
jgi:hypothetical protein